MRKYSDEIIYLVQIASHQINEKTKKVEYNLIIKTRVNQSFMISARFSELKAWVDSLKGLIGNLKKKSNGQNKWPVFPSITWFHSLDEKFIETRKKELEVFFQQFLSISLVRHRLDLMVFFWTHSVTIEDR